MSAQGLLHSVFSCSSPTSKTLSKRRLRQTRSLDPAIIGNYGTEGTSEEYDNLESRALGSREAGVFSSHPEYLPGSKLDHRSKVLKLKQPISSFSSPSTPLDISPSSVFQFDYDPRVVKRSIPWDLPFLTKSQAVSPLGSTTSIFSPRKWLQKKLHQSSTQSSIVWRSEGDFTWSSLSGRTVHLKAMPIQSLSELERVRLQEVAFSRLSQDYDMGCQITIPKDGHKRKKSLRRKLDALAKEKNKDKEFVPQAFGMPLSQVIANDRTHKQRQDTHKDEHRDVSDLVSSILQFATKRPNKELSSSNSSVSSSSETPNESTSPNTPEAAPRTRRRGAMSVDSITDLDDSQSRLLEALQLSLPAEGPSRKEKHRDKKLSLNPIYRQVPRLVDSCCQHLEKYGLQTVGIFRVGSSKKRVRQLREEFDRGMDVLLDEEHSIHDVAALLKEFLRDMPDPLLTKELYTAFINTMLLDPEEQQSALQLLIYLLPPCNCDTLHRLLHFLSTVAAHADDVHDKDGQEITGNKMTSLNLATIFGPNLLHKQKSSDKEFSVQSSARAEESAAIIAVVQRMIATYEILFMVPPDLQNEVLMSLLETDPDVVDYLLRRKASQWSHPDPFSISERHSSSDSNKASSGEVSPYDNNSPVLAERPLAQHQGEDSPGPEQLFPSQMHYPAQLAFKAPSKKPGLAQWDVKGLHGNMSDIVSLEQLDNCQDNVKQTVLQTQAALGLPQCRPHPPDQCRPHPPAMPMCSNPQDEPGPQPLPGQPAATLPDDQSVCSCMEGLPTRSHKGCDPPRSTVQQPGSSSPCGSGSPVPPRASPQHSAPALDANGPAGLEWQHWQRERWQIWQLLSSDNADTLPETLV